MTLTGQAAQQHPEIDALSPVVIEVATHTLETTSYGDQHRDSSGATRADVLGTVAPDTGTYRSVANTISEEQRRALGLRRNGRPRRQPRSST